MARRSEAERLFELTANERELWRDGVLLGGMDEVGRGPLAGPVVAACIVLPREPLVEYVNDSKKLSKGRREKLYPELMRLAIGYGAGWVSPSDIDRLNILNATRLAFRLAYEAMAAKPAEVLVDAMQGLDIPATQHALIHGDALSYLIGAASICAKVERDSYMAEMHLQYPEYGFDTNMGYGTAQHIAALKKYGPTPIHRRSFIKNFTGGQA